MAKAPEKTEEPAAEGAPAKPNKKRLMMIIGAVVAVLALGGGGAAFFMMKKSHKEPTEAEEAKAEKAKKIKAEVIRKVGLGMAKAEKAMYIEAEAPPVIVKLDQFTVKLQPDEGKAEQYMQTVIELEVQDAAVADRVKIFMSKIRAKVLLLLLGKTPSELSSPQGVELLSAEIRNEINQILDGTVRPAGTLKPGPDDSVQAVYLTQFIIQ